MSENCRHGIDFRGDCQECDLLLAEARAGDGPALEIRICEREACANIADEMGSPKIAAAIRARTCLSTGGHRWDPFNCGVCRVCGILDLVLVG